MRIVLLSGAGISAESGLKTFRDHDGLWDNHRVEDVATPEAFAEDPVLVHRFYNLRRAALSNVQPNAAHQALATLQATLRSKGGDLIIVTQNVDDLHERGGGRDIIHMHGELARAFCTACEHHWDCRVDLSISSLCPACGTSATSRPDIVWFGEMPYQMDRIEAELARADLFVSVGTSGAVYPAAGFVQRAAQSGISTMELNMEPSLGSHWFDTAHYGPATRIVPDWVATVV